LGSVVCFRFISALLQCLPFRSYFFSPSFSSLAVRSGLAVQSGNLVFLFFSTLGAAPTYDPHRYTIFPNTIPQILNSWETKRPTKKKTNFWF
jgi:hypothetical protein